MGENGYLDTLAKVIDQIRGKKTSVKHSIMVDGKFMEVRNAPLRAQMEYVEGCVLSCAVPFTETAPEE